MVEEGRWHRITRERIGEFFETLGLKYLHDHGEMGSPLALFIDEGGRKAHFSDADILVLDESSAVTQIIEIQDGGLTPKSILGIAGATALCNIFIDSEGRNHRFHSPILWIVLNSKRLEAEGSRKKDQMATVSRELANSRKPLVRLGELRGIRLSSDATFETDFLGR